MQSQSQEPVRASTTPGRSFTIIGFGFAAVALLFFPPIMGIAGAIFGGVGYSKGDKLGMWALIASIIAAIAGMALAAAVLSN